MPTVSGVTLDSPEPEPVGRRVYDGATVEPVVQVYVEERLRDTRHGLRNDLATLGVQMANAQLQATTEHAEVKQVIGTVKIDVAGIREDLKELPELRAKVAELKRHDDIDEARAEERESVLTALDRQRTSLRTFALGLGGLIIAATSIIVAVVT